MVKQVEGQRNAISSVSLDEEMSNMLKYQHAYNASARVVSVIRFHDGCHCQSTRSRRTIDKGGLLCDPLFRF